MTDVTTALVLVGPAGVGPFYSPEWRVGATLQLVEGSGNGPYWYLSSPYENFGEEWPPALSIDSLETHKLAKSLVLALWAVVSSQSRQDSVVEAGAVVRDGDALAFVQPWTFGSRDFTDLTASLSQVARLGIVILDRPTLISDEFVAQLQSWGFDVEVFDRVQKIESNGEA